jgi:hypothetical protein
MGSLGKESSERILSMGVKQIFYQNGNQRNLRLPFWSQVSLGKPGICSVGSEVGLDTAIQYFGPTSIIVGNIDPRMILMGSPMRSSAGRAGFYADGKKPSLLILSRMSKVRKCQNFGPRKN